MTHPKKANQGKHGIHGDGGTVSMKGGTDKRAKIGDEIGTAHAMHGKNDKAPTHPATTASIGSTA